MQDSTSHHLDSWIFRIRSISVNVTNKSYFSLSHLGDDLNMSPFSNILILVSWSASVCNADWILIATPSAICDEVPRPDRCYFVTNNIATVVLRSGWWFLGQVWVTAVEVTRVSPAAQEWGGQSLAQANVTFQFVTSASVKDWCIHKYFAYDSLFLEFLRCQTDWDDQPRNVHCLLTDIIGWPPILPYTHHRLLVLPWSSQYLFVLYICIDSLLFNI